MTPPLHHPLLEAGDTRLLTVDAVLAQGDTGLTRYRIVRFATYGRALLIDGLIQSCEFDEALYHEMLMSPAAALHGHPRRIVVIGGANGGIVNRLQHLPSLRGLHHVDLDPTLAGLCRYHLPHLQPQGPFSFDYRLEFEDPRAWLARKRGDLGGWADLVLLDLPDAADTSYAAGVFDMEALAAAGDLLAPGGLLVTHVGHCHPAAISFQAETVARLRRLFADVVVYEHPIPSLAVAWGFAIASRDRSLNRFAGAAMARRIAALPAEMRRHYDAETHLALLHRPAIVRAALDAATPIPVPTHPTLMETTT